LGFLVKINNLAIQSGRGKRRARRRGRGISRLLFEVTGSGECSAIEANPGSPCLMKTHRFAFKNVHVTVLPLEAREGFQSPGAGVKGSCELLLWCWALNSGSLLEQHAVPMAESLLQPYGERN